MHNTVSLDVAKKLKEAGWKKVTTFISAESDDLLQYDLVAVAFVGTRLKNESKADFIWRPQLHEILEELPYMIQIGAGNLFFKMDIFEDNYNMGYYEFQEYPWGEQINENPHDAAALLWVWCVENGYISLIN